MLGIQFYRATKQPTRRSARLQDRIDRVQPVLEQKVTQPVVAPLSPSTKNSLNEVVSNIRKSMPSGLILV